MSKDHTFNSTNLEDTPKVLRNMIRHTLFPRCGLWYKINFKNKKKNQFKKKTKKIGFFSKNQKKNSEKI